MCVCLCACLLACLCVCVCICLSIYLSIHLSTYLSIYLSIYLFRLHNLPAFLANSPGWVTEDTAPRRSFSLLGAGVWFGLAVKWLRLWVFWAFSGLSIFMFRLLLFGAWV